MRKKMNRFFVLVITICLVLSCSMTTFATSIDDAQKEQNRLEQKKKETQKALANLEKEKGDIINYIEKLDVELIKASNELERINGDITIKNKELKKTRKALQKAQDTQANQYDTMKKRIRYMYENGSTEYLEIMFSAEDMSDLLNRTEYIAKISEYDNTLLERYVEAKDNVAKKKEQIEVQIADLDVLRADAEFEEATLQSLVDSKNEELAKQQNLIDQTIQTASNIDDKIQQQEDLVERLLEEERKRQEELERQQAAANNGNGGSHSTNISEMGFQWPLPSSGRITSYFGGRDQPTAGASTYHKGVDIGAPTGSTIVAAADGVVVTSTYSVSAGNYMMISHGGGVFTVYMHCSKLLKGVGESVNRGDKIALVGSTGYSTGPHLHFGISVNGSYVNPLNYVSY